MGKMVDLHLMGEGGAEGGDCLARLRIDAAASPDAPGPAWRGVAITPMDAPVPPGTLASYRALDVAAKPGPSGAVAMIALITKKPGISREDAFRHWHEHIELAKLVHHKALSYRQFRITKPLDEGARDFLGLAVLGFADHDSLATGIFRTPDDEKLIADDVADFIDEAIPMIGAWY